MNRFHAWAVCTADIFVVKNRLTRGRGKDN
jgi:hypothetical protein